MVYGESPTNEAAALQQNVSDIIDENESDGITASAYITDLQTRKIIVAHNLDQVHFAASLNKDPIAELVLRDLRSSRLRLDTTISWTGNDVREGAGAYDIPDNRREVGEPLLGGKAFLKDVLYDMLNRSGNTPVRAFVKQRVLGGPKEVNRRFKEDLGLHHTALEVDGERFTLGHTTAPEALKSLKGLVRDSDIYQRLVKEALASNIYTEFGVRSRYAKNSGIELVNKVGILDDPDDPDDNNLHDVGIIHNTNTGLSYGYAFLHTIPPEAKELTEQARTSLAKLGGVMLRYAGATLLA